MEGQEKSYQMLDCSIDAAVDAEFASSKFDRLVELEKEDYRIIRSGAPTPKNIRAMERYMDRLYAFETRREKYMQARRV